MSDIITESSSISIIESQERANIDMLVATAKRYPRDEEKAEQKMIKAATRNVETAENLQYNLERDGHAIVGASVRMAEIAVQYWQNIRFGGRVVSNDGKIITGQGFCHDCENNIFSAFEVGRRITDKLGRTYSEDMQVVTGMAAIAIAFRNSVFKVIPTSIIDNVIIEGRRYAVGDHKTLPQRRTRLLKRLAALGVSESRVLAFLGYESAEQITSDDVDRLIGIGTAIKEGSTTVEETFGPTPPKKPNIPSTAKSAPAPAAPSTPAPPPPPTPPPPKAEEPTTTKAKDDAVEKILHPEPQKPELNPYENLKRRLENAQIKEVEFLSVLEAWAFSRDKLNVLRSLDDIIQGKFTIDDLNEQHLRTALMNWDNIAQSVDKLRKGEDI